MHDPVSNLAREWLHRAEHDLRVARHLLTMPDPPPESVGFHAQQCAEKALKGYLTFHRIPFERRHDLNYLIDLCASLDRDFEQFRAEADELTPYAVEFRYPDALPLMPLEPARATVDTAERIYVFTLARLEQIAP
jgi:HEPN domain-containing protein